MISETGAPPSSGAARHLLPSREKEVSTETVVGGPSPLVGEGGRRPDEGGATRVAPAEFARTLRRNSTEVERLLWSILRDRRLVGHKFRRQVPIGPYFADFACYDAKLIVELDGSQHFDDGSRDKRRDAELARRGFEVLRVWNSDVTDNRDAVLDLIFDALSRRAAPPSSGLRPPSPIKGEGHPAPSHSHKDQK